MLHLTFNKKSKRQLSIVNCQLFSSGQSLLEVVVAVGIVAALAVALVSTNLFTQKTSRSTAANTQASKLVQQNIEQMRILRDRNGYDALLADNNCYVLQNTSNPSISSWSLNLCTNPRGEPLVQGTTTFYRRIAISTPVGTSNQREVTVYVTWDDSGGVQTVSNTTILTNLSSCIDSSGAC